MKARQKWAEDAGGFPTRVVKTGPDTFEVSVDITVVLKPPTFRAALAHAIRVLFGRPFIYSSTVTSFLTVTARLNE